MKFKELICKHNWNQVHSTLMQFLGRVIKRELGRFRLLNSDEL
jgi:hypothetical protein